MRKILSARSVGLAGSARPTAAVALPLWRHWSEIAPRLASGTLLAGFDYDGTLAPIRPTPEEAMADETTREALAALASQPGTAVAVVSGRPVAQLRELLGSTRLWLVGLHGLEIAAPGGEVLPTADLDAAAAALAPLRSRAAALATRHPGVRLEDKGACLVLHTRGADRAVAGSARSAFRAAASSGGASRVAGFELLAGKETLEVRPVGASKGTAMRRLLRDAGAESVLYAGDDATDEDAFAVLADAGGPVAAVTIRIGDGEGPTAAAYTLSSQAEVGALLEGLLALRGR
jgi:trehalose 6-phosphate phosphatase